MAKRPPEPTEPPKAKPAKKAAPTPKKAADKADKGGGAYFANEEAAAPLSFISTGCQLLNLALGGGWCMGRIANIVGDKSTGKTLLAIEAAANFIEKYPKGRVRYCEAESAFDSDYAETMGFPSGNVHGVQFDTVEDVFDDLENECKLARESGEPCLYILDSLDSISDKAEMGRDVDEATYGGGKAKMMSQLFRRVVRNLEKSRVTFIIISQIRDKIGAMAFGKKWTRSGGRALDFAATHVVELAHLGNDKRTIRGIDRVTGVHVKALVSKNKVTFPRREAEFHIVFGFGIDDVRASLEWLKEVKGLKDIGVKAEMGKAEIAKYAEGVDDVTEKAIRKQTRTIWREIEEAIAPRRSKYA